MEREHITPQGVSIFHDKNENIHSFCLCLYVRAGSLFERITEFLIFSSILYLKTFIIRWERICIRL